MIELLFSGVLITTGGVNTVVKIFASIKLTTPRIGVVWTRIYDQAIYILTILVKNITVSFFVGCPVGIWCNDYSMAAMTNYLPSRI
jgi:ABC-type proline/glycine betaine transport system permease subunit